MKVRAKNIAIDPVYWHYGVKWPFGMVMEYDLADGDCVAIASDPRFEVEKATSDKPAELPGVVGRPKKGK